MGKSQKIAKLLEKRQKIEKEIEKLQKSCQHSIKSIKNVRENLDSSTTVIRYVCDECNKIIGYPSNEDINDFLKK
jgi:peptidoglycan hydrolase CwlO-like protein